MNRDLTISLGKNGQLSLFIPGQNAKGHHVDIPLSVEGLKVIRSILQERQREARSTIGMNGAPTNEMVKAFLETQKLEKMREAKEKAQRMVPGLDLSTLNL